MSKKTPSTPPPVESVPVQGERTDAAAAAPLSRYQQAAERTAKLREAIPEAALRPVTVDIPSSVSTCLAALPLIEAMRPEIAKRLPDHDLSCIDTLEDCALSTSHLHSKYLRSAPEQVLAALNAEGLELRDSLFGDAQTLARHRLVDGRQLTGLRSVPGYKALACDLIALAGIYREVWPSIAGKFLTELSTIERAEAVAQALQLAIGAREQGPSSVEASPSLERQRAFTLFADTYDSARRAISYLRWNEGDADRIAPSLYAGRSGPKKKQESPTDTTTQPAPTGASSSEAPSGVVTHAPAAPIGGQAPSLVMPAHGESSAPVVPPADKNSPVRMAGNPLGG